MKKKKKKRERENWDWDLGSRGRQGVAGPALMTVTAATSAAARTNQRPPRADLAPSPCCARGLHSVRAHHTEPRKTCSRVRGICNSAIMKREFVQPCAGQNSEFTSPPSPKKHVPVRQEQDKKKTREEEEEGGDER